MFMSDVLAAASVAAPASVPAVVPASVAAVAVAAASLPQPARPTTIAEAKATAITALVFFIILSSLYLGNKKTQRDI